MRNSLNYKWIRIVTVIAQYFRAYIVYYEYEISCWERTKQVSVSISVIKKTVLLASNMNLVCSILSPNVFTTNPCIVCSTPQIMSELCGNNLSIKHVPTLRCSRRSTSALNSSLRAQFDLNFQLEFPIIWFTMALGLLLLIGLGTLIVWLYRINKDYFVLSFFAPRVRTKDGRPLEDLVALAPGNSLFGNNFDLYGLNAGGLRSAT